MINLTGFADEISPDFSVQLDVLESEGIRYLELRGVSNKNVLKLTNRDLQQVTQQLQERRIQVSSIGSPIGKISILDDFQPHLDDFQHAIEVAKMLNSKYIRIFSFFIPKGDDASKYRDEVMHRMQMLVERAELANVVLLHENEKDIYGDIPERCLDILQTCASNHLRVAFDPANFVQCGVLPFSKAYPLLEEHIEYMHIKDANFEGGTVVPAGHGDGEMRQVLHKLKHQGYSGFMSLEPHLASAGTFSGFSGPDLFQVAAKALKELLTDLDMAWQ